MIRGGMKVVGNIQGGEDIYDLFENRNKFDDGSDNNKTAAGFHEGAHIFSSLGTVADVAGIFLPGAEELGAALNLTGSILDSVGDQMLQQSLRMHQMLLQQHQNRLQLLLHYRRLD